jgi:hypothetical protein
VRPVIAERIKLIQDFWPLSRRHSLYLFTFSGSKIEAEPGILWHVVRQRPAPPGHVLNGRRILANMTAAAAGRLNLLKQHRLELVQQLA